MSKRKNIIPIFIPHQGCKNDCIFCNQRHISGQDSPIDIEDQIYKYLGYFNNSNPIELAFYGGSFTGLDRNIMISYLETVNKFIKNDMINSIRLSTRPDYINKDILDILKSYKVVTIELGVQSMDDMVLFKNNRSMSKSQIIKASKLIKSSGFNLGIQMMTGLYQSSREKDLSTAFEIARLDPDFVRIYPTMVIEDTGLYDLYKQGKYRLISLEDTFSVLKDIVTIFEANNIDIIRIGLYSDGTEKDQEMIGPFHPSTRQIVYSSIFYDMVYSLISGYEETDIEIYINKKQVDYVSGYRSINNKTFNDLGYSISYYISDIEENFLLIKTNSFEKTINFREYCSKIVGGNYEA